jgi:hypothetical protein
VNPTEIENAIDPAHQVIRRHHFVEIEGIKELAAPLSAAPSSNAPADARLKPTESRFATRLNRVLQHILA